MQFQERQRDHKLLTWLPWIPGLKPQPGLRPALCQALCSDLGPAMKTHAVERALLVPCPGPFSGWGPISLLLGMLADNGSLVPLCQ